MKNKFSCFLILLTGILFLSIGAIAQPPPPPSNPSDNGNNLPVDITLDNINKVTGEAVDSTKDLKVLRSELDEAVNAIGKLAEELDRKIPFQSKPEIRLP